MRGLNFLAFKPPLQNIENIIDLLKGKGCAFWDFVPFFQALRQAGYQGRLSIEAALPSSEDQTQAVKTLHSAAIYMRSLVAG